MEHDYETSFNELTEEQYNKQIEKEDANREESSRALDKMWEDIEPQTITYEEMYEYFKEFGTASQMKAFIQEYGIPDKKAMQASIKEINKIRTNALVVQSNNLAEASQNLSAVELRIVYNMISYLNPTNEEDFITTKISISDLAKLCQLDSKDHYDQIYKACNSIMRKPIIITTHDRNGKPITLRRTWFIQLDTIGGNNSYILYKFHPDLTDELLQLQKYGRGYVKTQANILNSLGDVFPMRFFQLMIMNKYKGMAEYSIEQIIDMFQLKGKYLDKRTNKLNVSLFIKKVIVSAVDKINEITDIHIEYKPIKVGRKIESIQFFIVSKNEKTKETTKETTPANIDLPKKEESVTWMQNTQVVNMLKQLEENGFSMMYKRTTLNKFTNLEDFMTACTTAIANLTTAKNNSKGKPINNPGAFLFSEIMGYDPAKERFFAQEEAAAAEAKHQEERERTTKIEAAETWEDIIKQAKAQTDKEKAIKILQDAIAKKAQLYENYKKAYRLTYPEDPAGYDVDLEISYIRTQGISQLLDKQVNYNLLKTEK